MRSGKVRYNAISGWLPELKMPHSNLLCDWLFPSVFGFRSVRGRNKNTEKFSLRLRLSCDVLIHTCPFCGERTVRNCFSEDNSDFSRKEFAVTFKRPCQITQVSNTMDISLLTFGDKMEVGHIFFFWYFLTKNDFF